MKKVFALFVLLGMAGIAEAKYNAPEGIVSRSDKIANWQLGELDADGDGKLSLDEFKRKTENYGQGRAPQCAPGQKGGNLYVCRNNSLRRGYRRRRFPFRFRTGRVYQKTARRARGAVLLRPEERIIEKNPCNMRILSV